MKILTILTCHNRKEKTRKCIETITSFNRECEFNFVIVDDGSTDGTYELLNYMKTNYVIHIIRGGGNWFYSGGMHAGMVYAQNELSYDFDYMLMINDDVVFLEHSVQNMIRQSLEQGNAIIVGAMKDSKHNLSYGAIKYLSGYNYRKLDISEWNVPADTFNANCVLIPYSTFVSMGPMDPFYKHTLGDFDYGLTLRKAGYKIYQSKQFVGICDSNSKTNTWEDTSLSRIQRIIRKEKTKGAPIKFWFYFLNKNFGFFYAIRGCLTSYIRILIGH